MSGKTGETKGPVGTAATDRYAVKLCSDSLRNIVRDLTDLKGRGLVPQPWIALTDLIVICCRLLIGRLAKKESK